MRFSSFQNSQSSGRSDWGKIKRHLDLLTVGPLDRWYPNGTALLASECHGVTTQHLCSALGRLFCCTQNFPCSNRSRLIALPSTIPTEGSFPGWDRRLLVPFPSQVFVCEEYLLMWRMWKTGEDFNHRNFWFFYVEMWYSMTAPLREIFPAGLAFWHSVGSAN